jgi:hypothetical protein
MIAYAVRARTLRAVKLSNSRTVEHSFKSHLAKRRRACVLFANGFQTPAGMRSVANTGCRPPRSRAARGGSRGVKLV